MPPFCPIRRLAWILAVLCIACGGEVRESQSKGCLEPCPWVRTDLTTKEPRIEAERPERWAGAWEARLGFLGREEVRDLDRIGPQPVPLPAKQIRVLEQRAGSRLVWPLELGSGPVFTFVPLGTRGPPCACSYHVTVRTEDGEETVLELAADVVTDPAPAPVFVRLYEWRDRRVDLLLSVEGPPEARVEWGSPAVVWNTPSEGTPAQDPDRPPNVLLLGIDTLRADALGTWGTKPSVTPAMDHLAGQSDVWLDAFSTFNNTNPSFASILTGLYGKHHGVYDLVTPLADRHVTLAEVFGEAGYDTFAVIAARHLGPHASNLGQGFDRVDTASRRYGAELVVDQALGWLAEPARAEAPFFAWLHFFDPHTPHVAPLPYAAGLAPRAPYGFLDPEAWFPFRPVGLRPYREPMLGGHHELYAGEVAYLDRHLSRLLEYLEGAGRFENTVIALVADHGENLTEHGIYTHHNGLWDTTTHVPLMIRWPGETRRGRRISGLVQTLDLFPTLLAAAGLEPPASDGVDLRELTGDQKTGRRVAISEHAVNLGVSVRTPEFRLYRSEGNYQVPDGTYLYDLREDPQETTDVADRHPEVVTELEALLDRWQADVDAPAAPASEVSEEERERLRALGYVQ